LIIEALIPIGALVVKIDAGFKEKRASPARNSRIGQFLTGSLLWCVEFSSVCPETREWVTVDPFIASRSILCRIAEIGRARTMLPTSATIQIDFEDSFNIIAIPLILRLTASHRASFLAPKDAASCPFILFNADVAA
jgi:hypothetical protein